jgi:adenosine deaminase
MIVEDVQTDTAARSMLAAMPKAELHLHLDGSLRIGTIADLAQEQGLTLPVSREQLASVCIAPDTCEDLVQLLAYFTMPIMVLQTAEALERVTYELCEDVRRENVRYVEIRFAPSVHRNNGLSLSDIIAAVVRGWHAGRAAFGLRGGVILCALRSLDPVETFAVARAGIQFLGHGVVAFDLAGDEEHFPVLLHKEPLLWAKGAGYGMTVHAGEAAGAQSVRDAVEVIGVSRIGHGTRAGEDPSLLPILRDRRIALDMCPTSNVHTKVLSSIHEHPLARYFRFGIPVTISCDNRTVSDVTLTHELEVSFEQLGLSPADLAAITLMAIEAGFADQADRRELLKEYEEDMKQLGIL